MRFVPTKVHGVLDYLGGVILIAFPFALGFEAEVEMFFPVVLGVAVIVYSALTDFELGIYRLMPMPTHLAFDGIVGVMLLTAPFFTGFWQDAPVWPFVVMGFVELSAAFVTYRRPGDVTETDPRTGTVAPA